MPKKAHEATKKKKDVISNWPYLNLPLHKLDFHLCNTVVAVDLFVVVNVVVAVLAVVIVPDVVVVGKRPQDCSQLPAILDLFISVFNLIGRKSKIYKRMHEVDKKVTWSSTFLRTTFSE